ncbi:LPP20 family lipoprotein [Pseudomaricurvus sp. HS19]|uniref:LPP20 family lipoprotein n=1 Tax=Pseudomaricurvus sp. HS19 TaxID=2692626 RepID=UPI0013721787|nr:LPP20 family lipoprotein [Pseudomaricurvus sp. HS19]MYM62636.1 hypothetical protein [Pseudomaricurvus sp. HS19]
MTKRSLVPLLAAFALTLAGCGGSPTIESDLGIKGAPDWVNEGTQAVENPDGRYLYGVGFAAPMNDQSLQRSAADGRARAELARIVSTYVDSALHDYASASGDTTVNSIEQSVKSTTQTALSGAKIKGRWLDPRTGNIYSFAEMDMSALDGAISSAAKLSENFKQYYQNNATANFHRFVEAEQQ